MIKDPFACCNSGRGFGDVWLKYDSRWQRWSTICVAMPPNTLWWHSARRRRGILRLFRCENKTDRSSNLCEKYWRKTRPIAIKRQYSMKQLARKITMLCEDLTSFGRKSKIWMNTERSIIGGWVCLFIIMSHNYNGSKSHAKDYRWLTFELST